MSESDVEALTRSFRSRIALLVVLVAVGLAAALWSSTRPAGLGEPEDRRKILVVTRGSDIDYYAVLEQAGFVVEIDDYDDWLVAARTASLGTEAEGVALLLEHADRRGFGLVVFERPSELDLTGLELEPAVSEIDPLDQHEHLALSVGDFAFPHRLTVDSLDASPHLRLPGYGALEAVFAQPLISSRADPTRPTVAELQFEHAITRGRQMLAAPAEFAEFARAARVGVVEALTDGSGAQAVVEPLETGTALSTPDGGLLLLHHELALFSTDARMLELEPAAQVQVSWLGPDAVAQRLAGADLASLVEPCPSLAGGVLPIAELSRLAAAADGSAVAIGYAEGGVTVWRKTPEPGCEWAAIADLEQAEALILAPKFGDPSARSVAASLLETEQCGQVLVWALGEGADPNHGLEPTVVLDQTDRRLETLAFIDDRHLAVSSSPANVDPSAREDRIDLLDRLRPGVHLSVPVEFFAPERRLRELVPLAPATASAGPELLVSALNPAGEVELIRLGIGLDAWATFLAADPSESMITLIPEQLEAELLVTRASIVDVAVGPGAVVFGSTHAKQPGEVLHLDLETGIVRALTDNPIRDGLPAVSADGRYATFVSFVTVSLSSTAFGVPRVVALTR